MFNSICKRLFDCVAASLLRQLSLPLLSIVDWLIRIELGGPVLYRQQRPGLRGRPFQMINCRTMRDACDGHGRLLPDEERLCALGRAIRATSLGELP